LNLGVQKTDISITLGNEGVCKIIALKSTSMTCKIEKLKAGSMSDKHLVVVRKR